MKNKHLSYEERMYIEHSLNKGLSVHRIALKLSRPDSSIVREIQRNRYNSDNEHRSYIPCVFKRTELCTARHICGDMDCLRECSYCTIANGCGPKCSEYKPQECTKLNKSPFVCNGCSGCDERKVRSRKYIYSAGRAQVEYERNLKESRSGISISQQDMKTIDDIVSPLLLNGQSIRVIYMTHKDEIPCSESALYRYIDKGFLSAKNIDLPRRVRFKVRKKHEARSNIPREHLLGRLFTDFETYLKDNPEANIWEMDTVIGSQGGKCLLTLLYRKTNLMIAILLEKHTQEAVIDALNNICDAIGIRLFQKYFEAILTDRGTEFSNPLGIECDANGEFKTRLFYCDSYCSWQKGTIERNHELIRQILPKGKSFDRFSQEDIDLMMNHINNYPRESLNDNSPYELSKLLLDKRILEALGVHKIKKDDVVLKPSLLKRNPYIIK